jgi:hypothetical protein
MISSHHYITGGRENSHFGNGGGLFAAGSGTLSFHGMTLPHSGMIYGEALDFWQK